MVAEKLGIPGVVVTAPDFKKLAWLTGYNNEVPSMRVAVYPGAFMVHTNTQLAENTESIVLPQIIESLTKPITTAEEKEYIESVDPRAIVFRGTIDEVNKYFVTQKWSDGMPIIPPTINRIEEFLKYTDYSPDEEIGVFPETYMKVTPWNIAVNGVIAGCRPEYMPILIAIIQAMVTGSIDALGSGGTHSNTPYIWINGPVARQMGIDHGQGLITHTTNRVIGRALGLMVTNLAGYRIKENRVGTFGYPLPWVLTEDEGFLSEIGWKPYHVEMGFDKNVSTVTARSSTMWGQNLIPAVSDAETAIQILAYEITQKEQFACGSSRGFAPRTVLVSPPVARVLASGGYSKHSLKEALINAARRTTFERAYANFYASSGAPGPSFQARLEDIINNESVEKGKLPPWYPRFPGWEKVLTVPAVKEGMIEILVCGDPSRNKTQTMSGPGATSPPPTKEIKLPANWDALMEKLGYPPIKSFYL